MELARIIPKVIPNTSWGGPSATEGGLRPPKGAFGPRRGPSAPEGGLRPPKGPSAPEGGLRPPISLTKT